MATDDFTPPKYTIDLSLPAEDRYTHVAKDFREDLSRLKIIFDELLAAQIALVPRSLRIFLARKILRGIYDPEENLEIRGISKATGVELHLLVAFNVLLDLFMGCTSGGVRVQDEGCETKMLHFRTLDWGMNELRKLVVELNFVESADGPVIATSITYFGYVGVLTGVRKGLSISLNFRPNHDRSTPKKSLAFRLHQICVLFGWRRSIASSLRQCLFRQGACAEKDTAKDIAEMLKPQKSTSAYLIFSDGKNTVCMDNDYEDARIAEASDFIFLVNHDYADEHTLKLEALREQSGVADDESLPKGALEEYKRQNKSLGKVTGVIDLIEFSISRKSCVERLWHEDRVKLRDHEGDAFGVSSATVVTWMEEAPELVNEETHYGVIMDPVEGDIKWLRRYLEPVKGDLPEQEEQEEEQLHQQEEVQHHQQEEVQHHQQEEVQQHQQEQEQQQAQEQRQRQEQEREREREPEQEPQDEAYETQGDNVSYLSSIKSDGNPVA